MKIQWLSNFILAGTIRFLLMNSEYQKIISDRVEVSTALNSWKRGQNKCQIYLILRLKEFLLCLLFLLQIIYIIYIYMCVYSYYIIYVYL